MDSKGFKRWLEQNYLTRNGTYLQKKPQSDAMSRCNRVEKDEGNLDAHFNKDEMQGLLDILTYTRSDASSGMPHQHSIIINGDVVNGTASLRNAIKLYQQFNYHKRR